MSSEQVVARGNAGAYELLAEIASGGMATIHAARQVAAGGVERVVVVKRVHRHLLTLPGFADMLRDEARVSSLVRHPNIVPLLDVVDTGGELCLVFEYIEATSLANLLRSVRACDALIPPPVTVRIICDALAGLQAAHTATGVRGEALGVVHRDVSPQNILVGVEGISRLIDFGIAKAATRLTETTHGAVKGKSSYMSPEQAQGMALDRRSDLFSIAVVLYEALTCRPLFRRDGGESGALFDVLLAPIDPPSTIVSSLPRALDAVLEKGLERARGERFQTAAAFLEALEAAVAPAPPRDVARTVETHCGGSIEEQRARLTRILSAHALEPLQSPPVSFEQAALQDAPPPHVADTNMSALPRTGRWWKAGLGGLVAAAAAVVLAAALTSLQRERTTRAATAVVAQPAVVDAPPPPSVAPSALPRDVPSADTASAAPEVSPPPHKFRSSRPPPRPKPSATPSASPLHPNPYSDAP